MAKLFSCYTEGTLHHYLQIGKYLKQEPAYSDFKESAVVLNLKMSVNFDKLYEEFCKAYICIVSERRIQTNSSC
jgi:hypothetical protein